MARFCTQCGSQVSEEVRFCPRCGAPMATPPAGSVIPAVSYPGVQPAAPPTPPSAVQGTAPGAVVLPPAGKPSPVLKIVFIVLGVFVLIGVLGIASCLVIAHRFRHHLRMNEARNGGSISIGDLKIGSRDNAAPIAGLPVYPGATPLEQGAQVTFGNAGVAVQEYETDDPIDKVVEFYKEHLGGGAGVVNNEGHYRIGITKSAGDTSFTTTIDIETDSRNGKTKITVARIGR